MKKPLFLVDGYSLIYRAYFAFMGKPLFNPRGENSSAVFGFFRTVLSIFDAYNPAYLSIVMDSPVATFRHRMYSEYKANREKAPKDLHDQVPRIMAILDAAGIKWLMNDGYEADDIMATYARICREEGRACYIVSGDKDLLQLVSDRVKILRPDKGAYTEVDRAGVEAEWGVLPEQIVDYLSLTGDQSDNVPGAGYRLKVSLKASGRVQDPDRVYENIDCA